MSVPMQPGQKRRPSHIILFKHHSEKNVAAMCGVMGTSEVAHVASVGIAMLAARDSAEPNAKVYTSLAAASAELTPDEANRLTHADEGAEVVLNQTRSLPKFWEGRPRGHSASVPHAITPGAAARATSSDSPLIAYMRGLEDGIALIRRYVEPSRPLPPAQSSPQLGAGVAAAGHSWCLDLIGLDPAFSLATGKNVKIAVLDTGLDLFHPDFQGRIPAANLRSFVDNEPVQDGHGHGTHSAGVGAGPRTPAGGTRYGVAPDANLLIGKVLNDGGTGDDDQILNGIVWAAAAGARVITMSLETPRVVGSSFSPLYERIAKSLREQNPGVLLIAAAGNRSNRPGFIAAVSNPAACPSILAIAGCDRDRVVGDFSCAELDPIGGIDLVAPGVNVLSSWRGGGYNTISGTSMAAPHVAGVAALLIELNPAIMAAALANLLAQMAQPLSPTSDFGRGLVRVP